MGRLLRPLAVALLLAVSLAGRAAAGAASPELRIGILAPLSGPFASGGSSFVQAVTLAAEKANADGGILGRKVELVVADTQGRIDVAKSEALRLIYRENVFALVGAYLSEETVGVMEVAAISRVLLIVPVAATAEITDRVRARHNRYRYVFRVGYSIPQWAAMVAEFLKGLNVRHYAFVGAGIRWNRELAGALMDAVEKHKITAVYEAFYSPRNPSFEPIAVAVLAARPDILVLCDPGKNSIEFVKRIRETSASLPIFSIGGALGDARVAQSLPLSAPLYVQAAAWRGITEASTRYADQFEKRYGYAPVGYSDTLPYDALTVLLSAVRTAGKADTEEVMAGLEKGAFHGVAGTYRFDSSHQAAWGTGGGELRGAVIRWEKSGSRVVYPR